MTKKGGEPQMSRILVTGAAGYIGSHTCVELLNAGHQVVGIDSLANSSPIAVERVTDCLLYTSPSPRDS